jgi:hypothetical protein
VNTAQQIAGLPLSTWLIIVGVMIGVVVLYRLWAVGADIAKRRADAAADLRAQKAFDARLDRSLAHPEPVEPRPRDYIRAGKPVPPPRSTALLGQQFDALQAQLAGGGAAPGPLGLTGGETSKSSTTASAPGGNDAKPTTAPSVLSPEQVLQAVTKLPPPPTK